MRIGEGSITVDPAAKPTRTHEKAGPARVAPKDDAEEPSPFAKILSGLGKEVDRGEVLVKHATSGNGKDLGNGELLALQAGVYRYSEAVDLAAKLVDRASSGVKTVLQGQ